MDGRDADVRQPGEPRHRAVGSTVGEDLDCVLGAGRRRCTRHADDHAVGGRKTKQSVSANGRRPRRPGSRSRRAVPGRQRHSGGQRDDQHRRHAPVIRQEAETLADRLIERWTARAVTAKGGPPANPRIAPGGSVAIADAGPASGTYHVTEVEHRTTPRASRPVSPQAIADRPGWSTCSSAEPPRRASGATDWWSGSSPWSATARDPRATSRSSSPRSATRWRATGPGSSPSAPAPSAGMTFLPEVNDEVLVGFEGGDARRPVVLGGLFNGKDVAGRVRRAEQHRVAGAASPPGSATSSSSATGPTRRASTSQLEPGRKQAPGAARARTSSTSTSRPASRSRSPAGTAIDRVRPGRRDHPAPARRSPSRPRPTSRSRGSTSPPRRRQGRQLAAPMTEVKAHARPARSRPAAR